MVALASGKLMAVGATDALSPLVARYLADGTPDSSFGDAGFRLYDRALFSYSFFSPVRSDTRTLVASWGGKIVALDAKGDLDPTFGNQGVAEPMRRPERLALQADGKLLVAGTSSQQQFALARLDADGSPDLTFGVDGLVTVDPGGSSPSLPGVALQPDGKVIVAGGADSGGWCLVVMRFNADGTPDPTFGTAVKARARWSPAESALVLPDGRVLAGAPAVVVGFGADGSLDGTLLFERVYGDDLGLLPDGRVVALGIGSNATDVWYLALGAR